MDRIMSSKTDSETKDSTSDFDIADSSLEVVKTGSTPMNSGVWSYFNGRMLASPYVVCPCR